ncbi:MAG: AEC family transporter [Desulfuromonadales bacterium]|nr:AEC family transporter [Desulfuromonadales bacterium]
MNLIVVNILSLVVIFLLGAGLKKCGVFVQSDVQHLLKLFFYVSLPALILISIPELDLKVGLLFLPLSAILIIFSTFPIAFFSARACELADRSFGVFLLGAMIMNGGFTFPFILSAYGREGMALASLFDFGAAVTVFTFVYYQACRYGNHNATGLHVLRKLVLSPPLVALCTALVLNLSGLKIAPLGVAVLQPLADLTKPVVLLALGIAFSPRVVHLTPLMTVLLLRMGGGFLLGLLCCRLFHLEGLAGHVTLIMASAPSGMNTLVFSSMEDLESDFAASVVSYATLLGLFWTPVLLYAQARL